jgi:AcrR family transcriptional regulator
VARVGSCAYGMGCEAIASKSSMSCPIGVSGCSSIRAHHSPVSPVTVDPHEGYCDHADDFIDLQRVHLSQICRRRHSGTRLACAAATFENRKKLAPPRAATRLSGSPTTTVTAVTDLSPDLDRPELGSPDHQVRHRICVAAMKCFAAFGAQAAGLRLVAKTAGVSVGMVQHHFRTKGALIEAVNEELIVILRQAAPLSAPPADPVADVGHRLTTLIADHPDAVDYLGRVLIDDQDPGRRIFDLLFDIGKSQWDYLQAQGRLRPDLNPTWGALNPLVLVLGTLILRSHIERQLPESLASPDQLQTWQAALSSLISGGQLH